MKKDKKRELEKNYSNIAYLRKLNIIELKFLMLIAEKNDVLELLLKEKISEAMKLKKK